MEYPHECNLGVPTIFGEEKITFTLFSGLTTFVGPNASGKTQTLKALRDYLREKLGAEKVRYLSSNRMGNMELYRSQTTHYVHSPDDYSAGGREVSRFRDQIETATGDFFTLDERKDIFIKVSERLSVLFSRQVYLRWDSGSLKVYFEKSSTSGEYSVAVEASGLINVISILAALYNDEIPILLIDEPEVSLHPQLQSYVLREIQHAVSKNGKTVILSTHSVNMISFENVKDICDVVFFEENSTPKQISQEDKVLSNRKLAEMIVRMSQDYKASFFAKTVFLVEGVSDLIICRFLARKLGYHIDVAGTEIIPVEGKGQFAIVKKLFEEIGKSVVIMADLDGFTDDNSIVDLFYHSDEAAEIASEHGHSSLADEVRGIKTDLKKLIENHKDALAHVYEKHPYWKDRDPDNDDSVAVRRSLTALLLSIDDTSLCKWPCHDKWERLKNRINHCFGVFEKLGCFFLRKGALESYYTCAPNDTYSNKPSAAIDEIERLNEKDGESIRSLYEDIVRSLEFAAKVSIVDEGIAVRRELLSELAPLLDSLSTISNDEDIYSEVKKTKGTSNSLFVYKLICESDKKGIEVSLRSYMLSVKGFPLKVFKGDNVNELVKRNITAN